MPFDGVGFVSGECLQKLDAMIDLVCVPERWCKGTLRTGDGRYCLRGAIIEVGGAGILEAPILQAIRDVTRQRCRRIESFNDDLQTNHRLICAVLMRARINVSVGTITTAAPPLLHRLRTAGPRTLTHWRHFARSCLRRAPAV